MPIYEYRCSECDHLFETIQLPSQSDPEQCPDCGHDEVRRLVSQSSFQLKGGGWFADGYDSSGPANSGGANEDGDGDDGATPEADAGQSEAAAE